MTNSPAPQHPVPTISKIEELESLRGLAALLVVFFHLPKWNPVLHVGFIDSGYLMVQLFFVLSGFVIYNAYATRISSGMDLVKFQFLRFGRLYPVHFLFLMAYLSIEIAKYIAATKFGVSGPNARPFEENTVQALVQQIFLLQAIGPTGNATTFNIPAWSISTEFYTYLLFALILLFAKKAKDIVFLVIVVVSLFMLASGQTFGTVELLRCFAGFFLGCLTAKLMNKLTFQVPGYCAYIVILIIGIYLQFKPLGSYDLFIYLLTVLLILSLVLAKDGPAKEMLRAKVLIWLGSISYALYMSHTIVIWVANQVFRFVLKRPEIMIEGKSYPQLSTVETGVAIVIVMAAVLVLSQIVYVVVEKPMREKSRRVVFRKG
ncbi:acyltransferase [Duganella zoogloeoides]|uniref:Acyltransferase n=1 Tax=Duganella zoogloeoides TaxID=75659 RepID=A0ABZ0Y0X3_9BURK|nr:acyltransferase family protein [Duganella zoogloeoides]WQH05511.1 acyltransferase [Duganella zoogloeoides]